MPSPIYQNMVNLIVGFSIWRGPSIFMDVAMGEHRTFDSEAFRCDKGYSPNSIIITNFVQTFIPNCQFKNVFSAYFGTEIS
jgi:hypothetical protein